MMNEKPRHIEEDKILLIQNMIQLAHKFREEDGSLAAFKGMCNFCWNFLDKHPLCEVNNVSLIELEANLWMKRIYGLKDG